MRRLGEVIVDLVKKTGMQHTDANLKELIALSTPVPDEVEEALNSLMNSQEAEAWAKGNPSVKSHYTAQAYNGWDKRLFEGADKLGFSDEEKEQLKSERNTGKRQDLYNEILEKRISAAQEGMKQAGKKGDDDAALKWKAEYEKVSGQLNKTKEEYENKLKEKDESFYYYRMNAKIDSVLSAQKWSENYPTNLRGEIGRLAIQKQLDEAGAKVILDESGEPKLVRKDNIEMPYFDSSNKNPKFTEFATKVLSENKFLAVSTPQTPNTQSPNRTVTNPNVVVSNTQKRPNTVQSILKQSIKDQQG